MRRSPLLGLLLGLALLTSACGGKTKDPSAATLRDKIATQLRSSQPSLSAKEASCYSALLVKELGAKAINKLDVTDKAPDAATAKHLATAAIAAQAQCGIGGATTTSSTSTTAGTETTSTTAAGAITSTTTPG